MLYERLKRELIKFFYTWTVFNKQHSHPCFDILFQYIFLTREIFFSNVLFIEISVTLFKLTKTTNTLCRVLFSSSFFYISKY